MGLAMIMTIGKCAAAGWWVGSLCTVRSLFVQFLVKLGHHQQLILSFAQAITVVSCTDPNCTTGVPVYPNT